MKTLIAFLLLASSASAAFHHNVVVQKQVFVVSPFAVPTAVPVSPYGGYSYQQTQQAPAPPPRSAEEVFADKVLAIIEAKQSGHVNALGRATLFGTKCASCHNRPHDDGRPVFGTLESLSERQRLAAIRAMKSGEMPKGGKLSEQDASNLLDELLTEPEVAAQSEPPPIPEPPAAPAGE